MSQTKPETEAKGSRRVFHRERASNFIKGLGAYSAVALTSITWIIGITVLATGGRSPEINGLLPYLYVSILLLLCYSFATTKTANASISYKIWQIIKRFFDVVVAASAIFFLMPLFVLVAIAIKLESPGPILFRTKRVGQFGTLFEAYKFRTMYIAPTERPVTQVGRLLRRSSLNELQKITPQKPTLLLLNKAEQGRKQMQSASAY